MNLKDKEKNKSGYMVDVYIPPECLDPDGAECEHTKKEEKKQYNPV